VPDQDRAAMALKMRCLLRCLPKACVVGVSGCHVEEEKLRVFLRSDIDQRCVTPTRAIAGVQDVTIGLHTTARDLQPYFSSRRGSVIQTHAGAEARRI
jgi:hypothetical protein